VKPELETFRRETSAAIEHARRLIGGLDAEAVSQRPSPGEWSAGECLDHLTMSARAYHPMVEEAIRRGAPVGASEYKPAWIWRKFLGGLEPPVKRKFKAAPAFVPESRRPAGEILNDFAACHEHLIDALPKLDALDLGKIRIVSPFASWMRYPLGLVFYIIPAHCRRHLWQAEQAAARLRKSGERR
jgi:hypothetical protein